MTDHVKRWSGRSSTVTAYLAVPLSGLATPLILIPAITSRHGAAGWAAVAVGMSVGMASAVLVELAWGLTGPQMVAATPEGDRPRVYALATATKALALIPALPVALSLATVLAVGDLSTSVLTAAASTVAAFSPTWYFVGVGAPQRAVLVDGVPRVACTAVGALLILHGAALWVAGAALLCGSVVAPVLAWWVIRREQPCHLEISRTDVFAALRAQAPGLGARAASAVYIALPTALLSAVNPGAVASFSAVERLMRMGLTVLQSTIAGFQRWIGSSAPHLARRRVLLAITVNVAVGVCAAGAFLLAAPHAVSLLFSGAVTPESTLFVGACGVVLLTCISRATGSLGLVRFGRIGWITASATLGLAAAVVLIPGLGGSFGASGAMLALLVAETAVLVVQCVGLARASRAGSG